MWNVPRKFSGGRRRRPKAGRRVRLSIESFEHRVLLSTFVVVDLGDTGAGAGLAGDLRYCINSANANSDLSNRIVFQPGLTGTIRLTQGELMITKSLAIDGPGAEQLTISGNHHSGVFNVTAPASETVILSDLTIADGTGIPVPGTNRTNGGGLEVDAAAVTLNRSVVTRNFVTLGTGSGIYNLHGTLVLNSSTVSGNNGINVVNAAGVASLGSLTVNNSIFEENVGSGISTSGSAIISGSTIDDNYYNGITINFGSLALTASRVVDNSGDYNVGIDNESGVVTIVDTVIAGNTARGTNSGIYNSGQMTVTGSTIADNTAVQWGGGVSNAGDLILENSTISGNHVAFTGGGIVNADAGRGLSLLEITSCTITDNSVGQGIDDFIGGGGIRTASARPPLVRNSIIAGNTSATVGPDVRGVVLSLGFNLVGDTADSSGWSGFDITGTTDSPLDPRLGPLQNNGGSTPTHALVVGSPAFRAGDPLLRFSFDQRGSGRISAQQQTEVDIGAFNAGDATQFLLEAPAAARSGQPFTVTVTALDRWGNRANTYTGTVHFSSTDLNAALPDDTALAAEDGGSATFAVTLSTPGEQRLRASDADRPSLLGDAAVLIEGDSSTFAGLAEAFTGSGKRKHEASDWLASS